MTLLTVELPAERAPAPWMSWRNANALILIALVVRLIYLRWFTPYELVGDEAYYWVESQHLDWSYTEKGPLLPWAIALCCHLFGNVAWAVRLPVVLGSAAAAWTVARVTRHLAKESQIAPFLAAAFFLLTPAFHANAQICTQDGLVIPFWMILTTIGLGLVRRLESGKPDYPGWVLFGLTLGLGTLLKQSMLLFALSFPVYAVLRARQIQWSWKLLPQILLSVLVFAITLIPMIWWEHRHGWPLLEHTLGHIGFEGDREGWNNHGDRLLWFANTVGSFIGAIGPGLLGLMIAASFMLLRSVPRDTPQWRDRWWMVCAAWPSVLFYFALSLTKPVVPNWPLPSVVSMIPLAAMLVAERLPARRALLKNWRGDKRWSQRTWKPENWFSRLWGLVIPYGVGGMILISFPTVLRYLPVFGRQIDKGAISRLTGSEAEAQMIRSWLPQMIAADGKPPIIVASGYQHASLMTFYLADRKLTVSSAGGMLGVRHSGFDYWESTRLEDDRLQGTSWLIVDKKAAEWGRYFQFDSLTSVDSDETAFLGKDFRGRKLALAVAR